MADTMGMAVAERADMAEFLAGLTPEQWDAPTLCEGWSTRDVVAHMYGYEDAGFSGFAARLLRSGLNGDRANAAVVAEQAGVSPPELLAKARSCVRPRGFTTLFGGRIALTDCMIHQQDVRRPLGLHRDVPADRLTVALDFARTAPPIRAKPRVAGLRLVATDLGWTAGDGPSVEGPGEALLMAVAGRRAAVDELTGPGVATLRDRIDG
ncbi:maleylpyruvate isomerase family mycothiol-dependent enzyme [Pseudonocardia endophytica]|uniref:Uncharacterized protein (TIGR03083 family) n=1 Tax=Pseudonocardia endophytica TaxID=401976 RepID=A0A4V2PHJ6_PSEEN|nr:maleylpyruvate isomerase family mycothiol-dependent enzyme [Pseudonocardia endophytica]TCK21006.1 uncharacterized protein (TIGR03083 family) [Pseudonocardia endophytica]